MLRSVTTKKAPTTDAETLKDLVLWARANKLLVNEIQVGAIHIHYSDLGVNVGAALGEKTDEEAKRTIYERYGKALFDSSEEEEGAFDGITEDDVADDPDEDVPAVT